MGTRTHCFSTAAPPGRIRPTKPSAIATWEKYSVPSGPTATLSELVMAARLGRSVPQPPLTIVSPPVSAGAVSIAVPLSPPVSAGGQSLVPMSGPVVDPPVIPSGSIPPLPPLEPRVSSLRASIFSTSGPLGGGWYSRQPATRNSTQTAARHRSGKSGVKRGMSPNVR